MKLKPVAILLLVFLASAASILAVADVIVGVKPGDWVEYNVTFTGTPPPEHDAKWARMEVTGVEGQRVNATFTSQLANGSMLKIAEDLDFSTGRLIDMFIIPAGLNAGDAFYAQSVGNITIDSVEVHDAAGAARTVVHADAEDTQWYWDRASGVVVEAQTANAVYTLDTLAVNTGLWSPQILGLDQAVFYASIIILAVTVIAVAIVLKILRKGKTRQSPR